MTSGTWRLIGPDGCAYDSDRPGTLGGHRRSRIYGQLDCRAATQALAKGGYRAHRVFFADEPTAVAAGYRPCAVCMRPAYDRWKTATTTPPQLRDLEVEAVIAHLLDLEAVVVSVGHGRDARSTDQAERFARRWQGLGRIDEHEAFARNIDTVVGWPSTAASWLRPAQRLTNGAADAWVIADSAAGFAPVARRLLQSTRWDPRRTVCFSTLERAPLADLVGDEAIAGLQHARSDGTRRPTAPDAAARKEP